MAWTINADIVRGRISHEEHVKIEALAGRGLGMGQIAMKLNRHPATINNAMVRMGLRQSVRRTFCFQRNGRTVASFSPEEDAFIVALRVQDFSWQEIARLTTARYGHARTPATIGTRLKMLANAEDRQ